MAIVVVKGRRSSSSRRLFIEVTNVLLKFMMMYYYPFLIYSSYILQHNGWKIALCVVKIFYKPVISFNSTPTIQLQPKSTHVMVNIIIIFKTLELLPLTFTNSFPFYYRIVAKWRKTFVCYFNSNLVNRRVWYWLRKLIISIWRAKADDTRPIL